MKIHLMVDGTRQSWQINFRSAAIVIVQFSCSCYSAVKMFNCYLSFLSDYK